MPELFTPGLLFNKQKLYELHDSVIDTITKPDIRKAVIVYDIAADVLPQPAKEMLDKLIHACQFKPEETIYLNARANTGITLGQIQNKYQPVAVLVFGDVSISRNMQKLKKNFAYELGGTKVMNAESLDTLLKNDAAKKALWGALKSMLKL